MKYVFLLSLSLVFFSCSSSTSVQPSTSNEKFVTGIYYTTESTPTPISSWGTPDTNHWHAPTASGVVASMPFPNPASGATESEFVLYQPQTVSAWLSSANLADSLVPSGTTIPKITPKRIADLFVDATLAAGTNAVMISLKDSSNSPLPAGFYRIYLKAGNDTITRDVVLCYGAASDPCSIIHWK